MGVLLVSAVTSFDLHEILFHCKLSRLVSITVVQSVGGWRSFVIQCFKGLQRRSFCVAVTTQCVICRMLCCLPCILAVSVKYVSSCYKHYQHINWLSFECICAREASHFLYRNHVRTWTRSKRVEFVNVIDVFSLLVEITEN